MFEIHPYFEVVGEAKHGREAVEMAPTLKPDLIILDLSMPVMNGLEAAPLLIKILPHVWIIVLTAHEFPEVNKLLRQVGIHGVVSKGRAAIDLIAQAELLVYPSLHTVN